MNDASLKNFINDINDVRKYIAHIQLTNDIAINSRTSADVVLAEYGSHLRAFGVSKKLFEYKSITISLYGILEKYIGLWIKEYTAHLPKIVLNYKNFPEKFRDEHFYQSIKLLSLIKESKSAKYELIKKEDVLSRLSSCIEAPHSYELNGDAFYLHSGNLKHSKIVEACKLLDIQLTAKLKVIGQRADGFLAGAVANVATRGDELFNLIDDLVVRRNDIAHGEDIDDILNVAEFDDYVNFLEGYGKAIYQTFVEKSIEHESTHLYKKIENIKHILKRGSILCFEIEDNEIKVGDSIIIKLEDESFLKKEIIEIEKDNIKFDGLSITTSENIGLNLGGGLSKGQTFFIKIKQVDELQAEQ